MSQGNPNNDPTSLDELVIEIPTLRCQADRKEEIGSRANRPRQDGRLPDGLTKKIEPKSDDSIRIRHPGPKERKRERIGPLQARVCLTRCPIESHHIEKFTRGRPRCLYKVGSSSECDRVISRLEITTHFYNWRHEKENDKENPRSSYRNPPV